MEPLVALLKADDVVVVAEAALLLGDIGDSRAVEPLIDTLADSRMCYMRRVATKAAAKSLGKLGDKRAIEPLKTTLREDKMLCVESIPALRESLEKLGAGSTK